MRVPRTNLVAGWLGFSQRNTVLLASAVALENTQQQFLNPVLVLPMCTT